MALAVGNGVRGVGEDLSAVSMERDRGGSVTTHRSDRGVRGAMRAVGACSDFAASVGEVARGMFGNGARRLIMGATATAALLGVPGGALGVLITNDAKLPLDSDFDKVSRSHSQGGLGALVGDKIRVSSDFRLNYAEIAGFVLTPGRRQVMDLSGRNMIVKLFGMGDRWTNPLHKWEVPFTVTSLAGGPVGYTSYLYKMDLSSVSPVLPAGEFYLSYEINAPAGSRGTLHRMANIGGLYNDYVDGYSLSGWGQDANSYGSNIDVTPVPEPSGLAVLGAAALAMARRRKKSTIKTKRRHRENQGR
jgi:hypothetical protein